MVKPTGPLTIIELCFIQLIRESHTSSDIAVSYARDLSRDASLSSVPDRHVSLNPALVRYHTPISICREESQRMG